VWHDEHVKNVHYILRKPWHDEEFGEMEDTHAWWWEIDRERRTVEGEKGLVEPDWTSL
jgi:hypothetical protein